MSSEEKDVLDTIDSSNIFDEFEAWELKEEFQTKKPLENKNMYDYLSISAWIFSTIFWLSIFVVLAVYWYAYIQDNPNKDDSSLLTPICSLFLWDTPNLNSNWSCTSISYSEKIYTQKLEELKKEQFTNSLELVEQIYKTENFLKSKEIIFLDTITKSKLRPLEILEAFDKMKFKYDTNLQERIKCINFSISEEWILSASCEAFSSGYETNVKWFDGTDTNRASGTSISIASSFLNYIDKKSDNFTLLDKQKTFNSEGVISEYSYITMKTNFELTLQYNGNLINN
jgi:hypothetical protein